MWQKLFVFLSVIALAACSSGGANYKAGWVTKEITGKITPVDAFIIVEQENQTFLPSGIDGLNGQQGYLKRSSARIARPDAEGNYSVRLPDEVSALSLLVIAKGMSPFRKTFQRSMGVGVIEFDIELKEAANFKETYFHSLRPYLSGFITEKGYKMPEIQKYFLGQWMQKTERELGQ